MNVETFLSYFSLVYSIIINTLCFEKIMKINHIKHNKKYFIVVFIFSILNIINRLALNEFVNVYVCMALFIFAYLILYKTNIKETIVCALILTASSILVEFLFTALISLIFPNMIILNDNYIYTTTITIIFSTVLYLLIKIPFINIHFFKWIKLLKEKISLELFLGIIIVLINLMSILYGENYKDYKFFLIITVSLTSLISLVLLIVCLILSKDKIEIENKVLTSHISEYEKIADDYKEMQHNVTTDFLAIKAIGDKQVQDLVDVKIKKYHKNYAWLTNISNIPKGLQGLIYLKMNSINKKNILFEVDSDIDEKISDLMSIKDYSDLCDILGIVMDNAIEATVDSKEKTIFISMNNTNTSLNILVINTYKNTIDVNSIGKKNYSTKNRNSGIGLHYIKKVTKKRIKVKNEVMNNLFKVNINVPIKKVSNL